MTARKSRVASGDQRGAWNLEREFAGSVLGHQDRSRRLELIVAALGKDPSATFPAAFGTRVETDAAYDFFANPRVDAQSILEPHYRETADRCVNEAGDILVISDTTEIAFTGTRDGLGRLSDGRQGFLLHVSLAVLADRTRHVLGGLNIEMLVRAPRDPTVPKKHQRERYGDPDKESLRWGRCIKATDTRLAGRATGRVIHVMDREADDYALFDQLVSNENLFVIRVKYDRNLAPGDGGIPRKLFDHLRGRAGVCQRTVRISRRVKEGPPRSAKVHPPREERDAALSFCAGAVEIPRPKGAFDHLAKCLPLNLVRVWEPAAVPGAEAVEWLLITNLPVDTSEQILEIVDIYRDRWTIEDFNKALKSGCSVEKRQLEHGAALMNATAACVPLAYGLLRLRTYERTQPNTPAGDLLSKEELKVIATMTKLPTNPTVQDALRAIASLGGHMTNNGRPGWLVLMRGYRKVSLLADYERQRGSGA